jgi:hypothetical protein
MQEMAACVRENRDEYKSYANVLDEVEHDKKPTATTGDGSGDSN